MDLLVAMLASFWLFPVVGGFGSRLLLLFIVLTRLAVLFGAYIHTSL